MSMWIANAAATAMMCPIIKAILQQLEAVRKYKKIKAFKLNNSEIYVQQELCSAYDKADNDLPVDE